MPQTQGQTRADPRHVLLMDFWAEGNRGDAAMQTGLIKLVRSRLPAARLTVMAASGANQWPGLAGELDETGPLADDVVGGIRPWLLGPIKHGPLSVALIRKVVSGTYAALAIAMLPLWPLFRRVPRLDALLPSSTRRSVRALRSADIVLWNCRNIRGGSRIREPYEVWGRTYNAFVAILFGKPVACIGASIWPLRNPLSRFIARAVLGRTIFMSTRDPSSFEYGQILLRGKGVSQKLVPDLSLVVLAENASGRRPLPSEPSRIGLTIVDCFAAGSQARDGYIAALRGFLEGFLLRDGAQLVLVPQVTNVWQSTSSLEQILLEGLDQTKIVRIPGTPTVTQLTSIYRSLDMLIATRMHSAIFALSQGTPAVTIPYIVGGKWGILDMMGACDIDVPYAVITADSLTAKIQSVWARRDAMMEAVEERLPALAAAAADHVRVPLAIYLDDDL